ncbi:MAG: cupin domain-containing protein [Phenylobacterium sp.]
MRKLAAAVLALAAVPSLALADASAASTFSASPRAPTPFVVPPAAAAPEAAAAMPAISGLAADADLAGKVQVVVSEQKLAAGETMPQHRHDYLRQLFVVSGELKVSNLATGEEQLVGPGELATETAGDWHVATALGEDPVQLFVIDQSPVAASASN